MYIRRERERIYTVPFSAYWLRSSVVSVLISLIGDIYINFPLGLGVGNGASPDNSEPPDCERDSRDIPVAFLRYFRKKHDSAAAPKN